jgi:hypothetical protein
METDSVLDATLAMIGLQGTATTSRRFRMTAQRRIPKSIVWGLILLFAGCAVEPREGFYDRDHHRYYHDHHWHDCVEHDEHCR